VHRRHVIFKVHDAREDQPCCLALRMRTRYLGIRPIALQVLFSFVHHLVRCRVFKHPSQVRLVLLAEAEDALCGLAYQREAVFDVFFRVSRRGHRFRGPMSQRWPDAMPTFLSVAQCNTGSNRVESLSMLFMIRWIENGLAGQSDDLASFSDIILTGSRRLDVFVRDGGIRIGKLGVEYTRIGIRKCRFRAFASN